MQVCPYSKFIPVICIDKCYAEILTPEFFIWSKIINFIQIHLKQTKLSSKVFSDIQMDNQAYATITPKNFIHSNNMPFNNFIICY